MKFIKQHLSLIFPLMMLLFSFESAVLIQRAVEEHEKKLSQDYSIVIASNSPITRETLKRQIREVKDIQSIDPQVVFKDLQHTISAKNLEILKSQLPLFYSITLTIFPNQSQLKSISTKLSKIDGIQKTELFAKTHSKVYRLLLLLKKSILFFGSLLGILSVLLMVKQVEVWHLQHSKRMEIMSYLGAPSWMKNKILFKLAFIDSLIASLVVIGGMFYILQSPELHSLFASLEISALSFNPLGDLLSLFSIAIAISILSAVVVIMRQKDC